jgi:hypothetical protein
MRELWEADPALACIMATVALFAAAAAVAIVSDRRAVSGAFRCAGEERAWVLECMQHRHGVECTRSAYELFGCRP